MSEKTETIAEIELPYRRVAAVKIAEFDSGMKILRLVLREGRRITQVDLDKESAAEIGGYLIQFAEQS